MLTKRVGRASGTAMIITCVVACTPLVHDVDHLSVRNPRILSAVQDGWLAVDSSAAGVRAVLELSVETPSGNHAHLDPTDLYIESVTDGRHAVTRAREDAPRCRLPTTVVCAGSGPQAIRCPWPLPEDARNGGAVRCTTVVHLEFRLDHVPSLADSLTVVRDGHESRVRYAVRAP